MCCIFNFSTVCNESSGCSIAHANTFWLSFSRPVSTEKVTKTQSPCSQLTNDGKNHFLNLNKNAYAGEYAYVGWITIFFPVYWLTTTVLIDFRMSGTERMVGNVFVRWFGGLSVLRALARDKVSIVWVRERGHTMIEPSRPVCPSHTHAHRFNQIVIFLKQRANTMTIAIAFISRQLDVEWWWRTKMLRLKFIEFFDVYDSFFVG